MTAPPPYLTVTGVDGCARGWVAVTLTAQEPPAALTGTSPTASVASPTSAASQAGRSAPGERAASFAVRVAVAAALDDLPLTAVTGIDMPLGLLAAGWRDADRLARKALGRRGVTVFAIPPRPVLEAATYAEANQACRDLTGQGVSVQAYGLRRKIAEAERLRRRAAAAPDGPRLHEVHPELSFAALAGGVPLPDSKHTPAGRAARRDLLRRAGLDLPAKVTGAAEDDLLDAAAVAWSALRIAAGRAVVLGNPAQLADDGSEIAVRY